jgi:hypothetical protein
MSTKVDLTLRAPGHSRPARLTSVVPSLGKPTHLGQPFVVRSRQKPKLGQPHPTGALR